MNILPGSKITGASGKTLMVDRVEGGILICGDRRIKISAVVEISSPPEQAGIEIGDRLRRNSQPQTKYPKAWFPNGIDPRPPTIDAIESATVQGFSHDGYWISTPKGKTYHVSESSIEAGDWVTII